MVEPSLIECQALSIGYRNVPVLQGLDLLWVRGDGPLALTGPNGSGKSTFLKGCLGLLRPTAGALRILGIDTRSKRMMPVLRKIGWTPQQRPPGGVRISIRDLVGMGRNAALRPFSRPTTADRERDEEIMALCGLSHLAAKPVQELSGGQYQRAAIARALASKPQLLFLDEPTTFLDKEGRTSVIDLLHHLAGDGRTCLAFVSHDPAILELSGRQWAFGGGSAQPSGTNNWGVSW